MPRREGGIADVNYWNKTQWENRKAGRTPPCATGLGYRFTVPRLVVGSTARIGWGARLTAWLAGAQQCCAPTCGRLVLRRCGRTCRGLRRLVVWTRNRCRGCGWEWRNGDRWGGRRIGGDLRRRRRYRRRLGWRPFLPGRAGKRRGGLGCNRGSRGRNVRFAIRCLGAYRRWSCLARGNRPMRCASLLGREWDRRGLAERAGRKGDRSDGRGACRIRRRRFPGSCRLDERWRRGRSRRISKGWDGEGRNRL